MKFFDKKRLFIFEDLIHVAKYSFVSTFFKLLLSLTIVKMVAISIDKENYSNFYQFMSIVNIFTILSIVATETGIVKLVAQFSEDEANLKTLKQIIIPVITLSACLSAILLVFFSEHLSLFFFQSNKYKHYFLLLSPTIFFLAFNKFFLAFLNGRKLFDAYYKIDIFQSVVTIVVFLLCTLKWGLFGAVLTYCILPYCTFSFILFLNYQKINFQQLTDMLAFFNKKTPLLMVSDHTKYITKSLFYFSIYALLSSLIGALLESKTRILLISNFGSSLSATYDALNRFNAIFTVFTSSLISIYALPLFSGLKDMELVYFNLIKICKFLFPPLLFISVVVYFFRNWIISILFSANFLELNDLVGIQLVGCLVSTLNLILLNILITKFEPLLSIIYSILLPISYFFLNLYLTKSFYLTGLPIAYLINTLLGLFFITISLLKFKLHSFK